MNRYSKILHHLKENPETPKSSPKRKRTFEEYEADQKKTEVDRLKEQTQELTKNIEFLQNLIVNQHDEFYELREQVKKQSVPTPKKQLNEGLLNEPPNVKNSDPLTPFDQKYVTFQQLSDHYRLFTNRVLEQMATIGGGGAGRFTDLDDIVDFVFVGKKTDLPQAVNGVINLKDNYTYYFTTTVDLEGDRLVAGQNTTILGGSSENCRIKSTGISTTTALLSSHYSLPLRNITLEAPNVLNLDATGYGTQALDWFGVNFTNCAKVGIISSYNNFIMLDSAFLSSQDLTFDGTTGTIGFNQCLFTGNFGIGNTTSLPPGNEINQLNTLFPNAINGNGVVVIDTGNLWIRDKGGVEWFNSGSDHKILKIADTANITRRFRSTVNSFVVPSGFTGILIGDNASIPTEGFILDTCNFSGPGVYLDGELTDINGNKSLYVKNRGIPNTFVIGQLYMQNNATATTFAQDTWTKVAGTTIAGADISKFIATDNRLTCDAIIDRKYNIQCTLSFRCEAADNVKFGFYDGNYGDVRPASQIKHTSSAGELHHVTLFDLVDFAQGDYIEVYCKNLDSNTSITVEYMNLLISQIG